MTPDALAGVASQGPAAAPPASAPPAAEPVPVTQPQPVALSETRPLQLALSAAADFTPIYPTSDLFSPVTRATIVFRFDEAHRYERLTGTLIAVDVGDEAPPGAEVASTAITVQGQDRGALHYTLPRPFPVGTYRLDVTVDGELWNSLEFRVLPAPAEDVADAIDLMPLTPGSTWIYDFTQRAGAGAKMDVPEERVGADGVYRATATLSIASADEAGARVEVRREGELQTEEWWRADAGGIAATQSRAGGELTVLDPPRPVFPMRGNLPREWKYAIRDGSFTLDYRTWGPLPIRGPSGEAPGYVVYVKHDGPVVTTAERHFIPGVGMTKEVIVIAIRGKMMSRQEMILRSSAQ